MTKKLDLYCIAWYIGQCVLVQVISGINLYNSHITLSCTSHSFSHNTCTCVKTRLSTQPKIALNYYHCYSIIITSNTRTILRSETKSVFDNISILKQHLCRFLLHFIHLPISWNYISFIQHILRESSARITFSCLVNVKNTISPLRVCVH